jgi:hypothetical protein
MQVQLFQCERRKDPSGNIVDARFIIHMREDVGGGNLEWTYVLQPNEYADDISLIIKRECDKAVNAFLIQLNGLTHQGTTGQYTLTVDAVTKISTCVYNPAGPIQTLP